MRVISGDLKGRILRTPPGTILRPTQGHVRQVLFDIVGDSVRGEQVLDLFAGVGAVGIEALSRGAARATFVERSPAALRFLRENIEVLGLAERTKVLGIPVSAALKVVGDLGDGAFPWVFADPPYSQDPEEWVLRLGRMGPGAVLASDGSLVLETSSRSPHPVAIGPFRRYRSHEVGETTLEFFEWEGT